MTVTCVPTSLGSGGTYHLLHLEGARMLSSESEDRVLDGPASGERGPKYGP